MNDKEFQAALTKWASESRLWYLWRVEACHHIEQQTQAFWNDMQQRDIFSLHSQRLLELQP